MAHQVALELILGHVQQLPSILRMPGILPDRVAPIVVRLPRVTYRDRL